MLSERNKIVLSRLRANYYLKPDEGRLYRKRDHRPVKGGWQDKNHRYTVMVFRINGVNVHVFYHHAVWLYQYGELPEMLDHIDGDPANNRLSNLRAVTPHENRQNSVYKWKPNKLTGLPSVYYDNSRPNRWRIRYNLRRFDFHHKYEAFFWVMFIGRFYK